MCYDYSKLNEDIHSIAKNYNIIETFSIGKSVMNKEIPCLKIGAGEKKLC